jgi:HD-GYP domain-containing protein (c-di-GMP phosphodiesterase class II)
VTTTCYPGERTAFAELLAIVRRELEFEDRWSIFDWIRREMHAASPGDVVDLLDRAGAELVATAPDFERRTLLQRVDSLRERVHDVAWECALNGGTPPEDLVDAMHQMLRAVDPQLHDHLECVGALAGRIAGDLGAEAEQRRAITIAGRLLDVGKIASCAAGAGDRHAEAGEKTVAAIPALERFAPWVRAHHERLDGSGYPDRARGSEIPFEVRVLSVADVFHTLVTPTAQRARFTLREALGHLCDNAGTLYDPQVVESLGRVLSEKRNRSRSSAAA